MRPIIFHFQMPHRQTAALVDLCRVNLTESDDPAMMTAVNPLTSDEDLAYFPTDYADSRRRFNSFAQTLSVKTINQKPVVLGSWKVPGRQDDDLFVDHIYLPPNSQPKALIVLSSGIHGIEAYAGAAIQSMFFAEILPKIDREHTGLFIVHSMNPFGFKHHRRGTETNINLNRNFFAHPSLYQRKNEASRILHERFMPKKPVDSDRSHLLQAMRIENGGVFFDDVSLDQLIKSVAPGQFDHPENLEYGGTEPEPQSQALIDWLRTHMPEYTSVILLDLHTGLGHRGRLHLLGSGQPDEIDPSLFTKLFDPAKDKEFYEFTPADAEGFYETHGTLNGIFPQLAHKQQKICAMTLEFGTLGHDAEAQIEGINRWLIDHQGLLFGFVNQQLETKAKADFLEKFFPHEEKWRKKVIAASRGLFLRFFARLGAAD